MANSSFEDMLEQSFQESKEPTAGDIISGKVIEIDRENVFIHFGGKTEGIISINEFQDKDENITIKKGDELQIFYLGMEDGDYLFTAKPGLSSLSEEILRSAQTRQFPIYGKVVTHNGRLISFFSVPETKFKTIGLKLNLGERAFVVPLSPAFQSFELKFGNLSYEIPSKK